MALRSHRLCCHRSICRGVLLSPPISLPLFHSLTLSLSPLFSLCLSLTYAHTRVLRLALSPYGSRPCRSFIIHTVLKVQHLTEQSRTHGQSASKRPLRGREIFKNKSWSGKEHFARSCCAKKVAHVLMLESASEVNAASVKREKERKRKRDKWRKREREREGKIKDKRIWSELHAFDVNAVDSVLTHRNVKAYVFFIRVISTQRAHATSIPERVKRIRYYPPCVYWMRTS